MYEIKPLPTMAPSSISGGQAMTSIVVDIFNKVVVTLRSIPVIPNPSGYFDPATGEWLTPLISFFDVLTALLVVYCTVSIFFRLSGVGHIGSGTTSLLRSK